MMNYPSIGAQRRAKACLRREQNNKLAVATLILSGIILMWARGISEFGAVIIIAYHPMTTPVLIEFTFVLLDARPGDGGRSRLPAPAANPIMRS